VGVGYGHAFRDSPVIGNYYDLDYGTLSLAQQIGAFVLTATCGTSTADTRASRSP
jgi:hypothetical protein